MNNRVSVSGQRRSDAVLCAALLVAVACSSDSAPPTAAPSTTSPAAARYLDEFLTLVERNSIMRNKRDWTAIRAEVTGVATGAQSIPDLYPAIRRAFERLDDDHSAYIPLRTAAIAFSDRMCEAPFAANPSLSPDIGYLRVPEFAGTEQQANALAAGLQEQIRTQDRTDRTGWIIDLRGNRGGNMYPMILGIAPLLGEGITTTFVNADGSRNVVTYRDGGIYYDGGLMYQVAQPYTLRTPDPRIAVLIDGRVASSGEATLISLLGRSGVRVFGTPTCGLTSGNRSFFLSDTARLVLASAWTADRNGRAFEDRVPPDEQIANATELVNRAVLWLRGQ